MPSEYVGQARPQPGNTAPAPNPSAGRNASEKPSSNLPQDGIDGVSLSSIAQEFKNANDWLTWINTVLHAYAPILPVGSTGGFSAVVQYGNGTGTLAVSDNATTHKASSGQNFVVKITTGGAVGTAQYAISTDGGATYSASAATAASVNDVTTGIVLAFAGTFALGDMYAFAAAVSAQAYFADAAGAARLIIDHNGFPMGRISILDEPWIAPTGGLTQATPVAVLPKWSATHDTGVAATLALLDPTATYQCRMAALDGNGDTAVGALQLFTSGSLFNFAGASASAFHSLVCEFEAFADKGASGTLDDSQARFFIGFSDAEPGSTFGTGANLVGFYKNSGASQNWQCITSNGSSQQTTSTGALASGGTIPAHFRIEIHGNASQFGAFTTLFFYGGFLVAAHSSSYPAVSNAATFWIQNRNNVGGNNKVRLMVGPVRALHNRASSTQTVIL